MNHFIRFTNIPLSDPELRPHLVTPIRSADLQNCPYVGDPTLLALAQLPNLQALRWVANPAATAEGHQFLAAHSSLQALNVSACAQFTNLPCKTYLQSLSLKSLDVSFCPLTDEAFSSIKAPLTFLNLQGCTNISDRTLLELSNIPTLKHLYLAFNKKITKVGLDALKKLGLQTLKIYGLDI